MTKHASAGLPLKQEMSLPASVSSIAASLAERHASRGGGHSGHHAARPDPPLPCMRWFWSRCSIPRPPSAIRVTASASTSFECSRSRPDFSIAAAPRRSSPPANRNAVAAHSPGLARSRRAPPWVRVGNRRPHSEGVPPAGPRRLGIAPSIGTLAVVRRAVAIGAPVVVPLQGTGHSHSVTQGAPLRGDPGLRSATPSA